ncbi:hypothetical protein FB451DRAFT_1180897 [Mycena latifolia]|nr:hypothetical protein FB451DRAFT_1180897 [Mycena latifolia]
MPAAHRAHRCPTGITHHVSQAAACHAKRRESLGFAVGVSRDESEEPEVAPEEQEPPPRAASPEFFSHEVPDEEDDDDEGAQGFVPHAPSPEPEPEAPAPQSRRATVEEVMDEDDPQNFWHFVEAFPGEEPFPGHETFVGASAETMGQGETVDTLATDPAVWEVSRNSAMQEC